MKIAYLDHYDSFTYNLIDWLLEEEAFDLRYVACDDRKGMEELKSARLPLVISPGPLRPESLPLTMQVLESVLGRVPVLGVCLGHQCLGVALGGVITRAQKPFHGSGQEVRILQNSGFINSLSTSFIAAHYNSLVVARGSLAEKWVWAENAEREIEGIYWNEGTYPALGVQYHPESFLSEDQDALRKAWRASVAAFYAEKA